MTPVNISPKQRRTPLPDVPKEMVWNGREWPCRGLKNQRVVETVESTFGTRARTGECNITHEVGRTKEQPNPLRSNLEYRIMQQKAYCVVLFSGVERSGLLELFSECRELLLQDGNFVLKDRNFILQTRDTFAIGGSVGDGCFGCRLRRLDLHIA